MCGVLSHLASVHRCARSVCCVVRGCSGPLGSCSPPCLLCVLCYACGVLGHFAPVHWCARSVCSAACAVSWATWHLFTGLPARCFVLRVRCPGPLGSRSPVRPLRPLLCLGVSPATWLLFSGVPARCVDLRVRCPGPLGSCSPVCPPGELCCVCCVSRPLGSCSPVCPHCLLCCVCVVLGHLAPVHRCGRSVFCVACAVSWAPWLLFTGMPAGCVVLCVRCTGPLESCSPVCPFCPLLCLCGVLGHLAPVHRCARSVCCVVRAVSWATWLLFTAVPALCVVLRVRRPGPLASCSLVCPLGVFCCVCGVVGHLAPVHRCACSVCCVVCAVTWATQLPFTSAPAPSFALLVRCPGPLGSCSAVCLLGVLICLCGVLGHLASPHQCARSVCCVVCAVSRATLLLFTSVPALSFALLVRCPRFLFSCSPVCTLGVLLCMCRVPDHLAPVHRCARSVGCVARALSWATWLLFTGVPARWVVLRVRCPGPLGPCSPVCPLGVLCFGLRVRCCVCGASLQGAHSSIRTAAVRSRQDLGTLRARTRPSGRRLFVAGKGWVPSGRALIHPDGSWCCLAPVLVPWFVVCCARSPGLRHPAAVVAWHLSVCLGCDWRHDSQACLVAVRGAPSLVRSGRPRCSGRLFQHWGAFPHPRGLRLRIYWVAARGTRRPAENRAHCACRWPPSRQVRWASSALYPFGAKRWGCAWRVPLASVLGCVRCGGLRVWTQSLTRPFSRTVRPSTGDSAGAPELFRVDADTSPCGSQDATRGSSACVRVLVFLGQVRQAGLPGAF